MTRVQNIGRIGNQKAVYYHCTRCCKEATPSCLLHKQQIEIFLGSEIEKLDIRRQYQCNFCSKIGFSSSATITCWFCNSRDIKLVQSSFPVLNTDILNKDTIGFNCTDSFWPHTYKKIQIGAHASVQIKTIIPLYHIPYILASFLLSIRSQIHQHFGQHLLVTMYAKRSFYRRLLSNYGVFGLAVSLII